MDHIVSALEALHGLPIYSEMSQFVNGVSAESLNITQDLGTALETFAICKENAIDPIIVDKNIRVLLEKLQQIKKAVEAMADELRSRSEYFQLLELIDEASGESAD